MGSSLCLDFGDSGQLNSNYLQKNLCSLVKRGSPKSWIRQNGCADVRKTHSSGSSESRVTILHSQQQKQKGKERYLGDAKHEGNQGSSCSPSFLLFVLCSMTLLCSRTCVGWAMALPSPSPAIHSNNSHRSSKSNISHCNHNKERKKGKNSNNNQ